MAEGISAGFGGGLMRYKEEYDSKLKFSPEAVIVMIILVIGVVAAMHVFFDVL